MKSSGNLILFLNRWCPVGCASCNAGVSNSPGDSLSPRWLTLFFNRLADGALDFPGYVIWTGGEPFLSFDSLKTGIQLATQHKYHSEILTSGIWFAEHPHYLSVLKQNGTFSLRISTDSEHQERVPVALLISLIKEARQMEIEVNFTLRQIPDAPDSPSLLLKTIKESLPDYYEENLQRTRWLHHIPHMPIEPVKEPSPGPPTLHPPTKKCLKACNQGFKDIVIGADGLLYPCCGLFGIANHQHLAVGNPLTETWNQLTQTITASPLFSLLKKKGPYGVCEELGLEPEKWGWEPFKIPCQLCIALFRRHGQQVLDVYSEPKPPN